MALFAAELALRGPLRPALTTTRDRAWQVQTRAMHAALHQPSDVAGLHYEPRPSSAVEMPYGLAAFGPEGLRQDAAVSPTPGPDLRLVVLGDSLVWGSMLAAEETVPAALGRALGPGHEVLNAGVTGYDTPQEALYYRHRIRRLLPDVVVLVYCLNDGLTLSGPFHLYAPPDARAAESAERAWLDAVAPLRNETLNRQWFRERGGDGPQVLAAAAHAARWLRLYVWPGGYTDEYLLAGADPARRARTAAALTTLGQDLQDDGVTPVLVISPALYWWHRYPYEGLHAQVRADGEAAGFTVLDPLPVWQDDDPATLRFDGDNVHYTAAGAARLGAFIAGSLRAHGLLERPARPPG